MTYHPPTPPPTARKGLPTPVLVLVIIVGVVLLLCAVGIVASAIAGNSDDKPASLSAQDQANRSAAAPTTTAAAAPSTSSAPAATTTAPTTQPAKPKPTTEAPVIIGDGTYRVGEDIPAGRYKVTERAGEFCYWARTKGDNILDNSIAGGFPQFTAKTGEDVEITGCPEFERQGK